MIAPAPPRIAWVKTPGSVAQIGSAVGAAIYAKSPDGRFIVWVSRWRAGQPGRRSNAYLFSATDYGRPSHGNRYTDIPIPDTARSSAIKTMAAVERYAAQAHTLAE